MEARNSGKEDQMNEINPKDLRVEIINNPICGFAPLNSRCIRITHIPTGLATESETHRSQHGNRELAYQALKKLLAEAGKLDPARQAFDQWRRENISTEKDAYAFMEGWKACNQTKVTKS